MKTEPELLLNVQRNIDDTPTEEIPLKDEDQLREAQKEADKKDLLLPTEMNKAFPREILPDDEVDDEI